MSSFNQGSKLEELEWYHGLLKMVEYSNDYCQKIIDKIPREVLEGINRQDLFRIVSKYFYDAAKTGNPSLESFAAYRIARAILYKIADRVEDELFRDYEKFLDENFIHENTGLSCFFSDLKSAKEMEIKIAGFFIDNPGLNPK